MTEDIITDLAQSRALEVIARNTMFTYRGKPVNVRDVGREVGARYVLEGSIQRDAEQLRVTAQLITPTRTPMCGRTAGIGPQTMFLRCNRESPKVSRAGSLVGAELLMGRTKPLPSASDHRI